jgi:putative hydrolase of the HAD superfamily
MIGNKLDVDCMGAVNAGMSAILVSSTLDVEEKERVNEEDIDIIVLDSISDVDTVL